MPYTVNGDLNESRLNNYKDKDFNYEYPDNLDLKPGSELHEFLRTKIWRRAQESHTEMSKRFSSWNEVDEILTTYINPSVKEEEVKDKDPNKPISIVFPYSYSNLESLLTYMSAAFFQDPMFQYEGVEDDDTKGAMLMELVIRLHCIKSKVPLAMHTVLRDNFAYGLGTGVPTWKKQYGKVPIKSPVVTEDEAGVVTGEPGVQWVDGLIYEGNALDNVDPYLTLLDPSCASHKLQDGEFCGWISRDNYMNLLSQEGNKQGLFNVKYLSCKTDKRSVLAKENSHREKKTGGSSRESNANNSTTSPVDVINLYVTLIPKEWKLGTGEYPEKWFFRLAADDVIIGLERANHHHGLYPMAVASSEFDGYSMTPISRLEILKGLQGVLDWLFNSHIANVRKAINDMFIVDPYLVNINDVKDPGAGKLIRLRRPAWGHGVDKVIQQLQVTDITRNNIADSSYITSWMDRISKTDQSMSGSLRMGGPERLTKGEFQGTRASAMTGLQRLAMIIGMQFMQDIGTMFAVHTQQYMTKETFVKITGRNEEQLKGIFGENATRARVNPLDIAVSYDMIVRDGSIPGGNFSEAWVQMFQIIAGQPELYQQFDITRIFMYIAGQLGAKNVEDFKRNVNRIQPTQMPDEQVMRQVEKGNLIPTGAL